MTARAPAANSAGVVGFGYALWLIPDEALRQEAARAIEVLSRRLGGPSFLPHITLCARLLSEERARQLASQVAQGSGPELRLARVTFGTPPFRACVLEADRAELLSELEATLEVSGVDLGQRAPPHLSVFYGQLDPSARAVCEQVLALPWTGRLCAVEVWDVNGPVEAWTRRFRAALRG